MSQEKTFKTFYHRDFYGVWMAHINEIEGRNVKDRDSLIMNAPSRIVCQKHLRLCLKRIVGDSYTQFTEISDVVGASPNENA